MSLIKSLIAKLSRRDGAPAVELDQPAAAKPDVAFDNILAAPEPEPVEEAPAAANCSAATPWESELAAFNLAEFPTPAVIHPYDPDTKWEWGNIHVRAFLHTGAIVEGGWGGGRSVVLKGWGSYEHEPGWGHSVVERTINPGGIKYGEDREHCTYPCAALNRGGYPQRLVRSLTPLVPAGTCSDDPALLVVPYGRYAGLMLGQLTPAEKEELLGIVRRWDARQAIKAAVFWPEAHALRPALAANNIPELPRGLQFSITQTNEAGKDVWVAGAMKFLQREEFARVNERARRFDGKYQSVQRGASITGFHFNSEHQARAFAGVAFEISVAPGTAQTPQVHV